MYRKLLCFVVVFGFLVPFAHADEASKRSKIEEILLLKKLDATFKQLADQNMGQVQQMVKGMFGDHPLPESDQKIMNDFTSKAFAIISQSFSWEKLKPAYIDLYASTYTEEEVDGLLVFYKSPIGQSVLAKTPELTAKTTAISNAQLQAIQPQLKELMNNFVNKLDGKHKASPK